MTNETRSPAIITQDSWLFWIEEWIKVKKARTGSLKTEAEYRHILITFRAALQEVGLELYDDEDRLNRIAVFAERWAATPQRFRKDSLKPSTIRHRLDIISSFYNYLVKRQVLASNPMKMTDRPKVEDYGGAKPLDIRMVQRALKSIPIDTIIGRRDFALLVTAFSTGKRANEIAQLNIKDLGVEGETVRVTWHTKGGKTKHTILPDYASNALRGWLITWYGEQWHQEGDAPVWVRVEGHEGNQRGQRLSYWGIRLIYQRWLGVGNEKIHASRHTFALLKLKAGASLLELMDALGHASLDVTYRYARHIQEASETDRHAKQIGAFLGLDEEDGD